MEAPLYPLAGNFWLSDSIDLHFAISTKAPLREQHLFAIAAFRYELPDNDPIDIRGDMRLAGPPSRSRRNNLADYLNLNLRERPSMLVEIGSHRFNR